MKSGNGVRKIPETPLGTSSSGTLHAFASLFQNRLLLMLGTKITIIDICDKRTTGSQLQGFSPKLLLNGSKQIQIGIDMDSFQDFLNLLQVKKTHSQ